MLFYRNSLFGIAVLLSDSSTSCEGSSPAECAAAAVLPLARGHIGKSKWQRGERSPLWQHRLANRKRSNCVLFARGARSAGKQGIALAGSELMAPGRPMAMPMAQMLLPAAVRLTLLSAQPTSDCYPPAPKGWVSWKELPSNKDFQSCKVCV